MIVTVNGQPIDVLELKIPIDGLAFLPQMVDFNNDADWETFTRSCTEEVTERDRGVVAAAVQEHMTDAIVEIGVGGIHRPLAGSFTQLLIDAKPIHIPYLGIDCEDKSYLNNEIAKVYTVMAFSEEQAKIRSYMKEIGIEKISILFIDGFHSINTVANDWLYTDLLSDDGIVIFHDTNYHPGPTIFVQAIDRTKYRVEKHFEGQDDYGVAIAYKL
jgi:hypothetical protein